jgi:hypothetical protein
MGSGAARQRGPRAWLTYRAALFAVARDAYVDAARAARAAIDRARGARRAGQLQPLDFDVLMGCVQLIALFSRTSDEVGARQLAGLVYQTEEPTGFQRDRVGASLRRLRDADVIELETRSGRSGRRLITFPTQASASAPGIDQEHSAHALDTAAQASADHGLTQRESKLNAARRVGHSEKYSEKVSEESEQHSAHALDSDRSRAAVEIRSIAAQLHAPTSSL